MPKAPGDTRDGPLVRGVALLRLLATAGRRGASLTDLARHADMANSTVHRLLSQMISLRLVTQLEASRLYAIGPLAYELGLVAAQQFDVRELCRPAMDRLAAASAETIYFIQRSGYDGVCVDLNQGATAVRVTTLSIGSRRPLGLGAGGLAIVAGLPADEAEAVLAVTLPIIEADWQFDAASLRRSLEEARQSGFAQISNRITPGVTAIGKWVKDSLGQVFGAVTIAGPNARMTEARLDTLVGHLETASRDIAAELRGHRWARY